MKFIKLIISIMLLVLFESGYTLSQSPSPWGFGWLGEDEWSSCRSQSEGCPLEGIVYKIPNTYSTVPTDISNLEYVGVMYTSVLDVQPNVANNAFLGRKRLSEWFAINYAGNFDIDREGLYRFRLVSDDGSILYIDGNEIINNDGFHPRQSRLGEVYLTRGVHEIDVKYFQGAGEAVLRLFWTPPWQENEEIFSPEWTEDGTVVQLGEIPFLKSKEDFSDLIYAYIKSRPKHADIWINGINVNSRTPSHIYFDQTGTYLIEVRYNGLYGGEYRYIGYGEWDVYFPLVPLT